MKIWEGRFLKVNGVKIIMKIIKVKTLNEEIESISDIDYSVMDHKIADAKR